MTYPASLVRTEKLATSAPTEAAGAVQGLPTASVPFAHFRDDSALVRGWRRLETAATLPTQSLAFLAALAGSLGTGLHLEIFFVGGDGGFAALLPLCRRKGRLARWELAGAFEPGDALCRSPAAAPRLAEAIVRDSRPLQLDRLAAESPLVPALKAVLRGRGWTSVRPAVPTPVIALDPSWKDPTSRFNSGRRSDFRRAARRAAEFGEVSFEILSPSPAEFDVLFGEAVAVEARGWKGEAGTAVASDRATEGFYRDFFRSAAARGEFRLAFMRIDGRAIAMQMALETLGRYWLFKIGFDEDYKRCSPGVLLMLHTIGKAAERGLSAYELLGKAEPWIAQFWTREQRDCVRLRTYPFNMSGAVAFIADAVVWLRTRLARRGR